jgi:hypothetical protein
METIPIPPPAVNFIFLLQKETEDSIIMVCAVFSHKCASVRGAVESLKVMGCWLFIYYDGTLKVFPSLWFGESSVDVQRVTLKTGEVIFYYL